MLTFSFEKYVDIYIYIFNVFLENDLGMMQEFTSGNPGFLSRGFDLFEVFYSVLKSRGLSTSLVFGKTIEIILRDNSINILKGSRYCVKGILRSLTHSPYPLYLH